MDATAGLKKLKQQTQTMLIKTHELMVKRIAYHLLSRLPNTVQIEDLIQVGMIGLLDAARHYDITKGASFETYASIRIRGCMLDEMRRNDWVPRRVYRHLRLIDEAAKQLSHQLGRKAKDREIARALDLPLEDYFERLKEAAKTKPCGIEDLSTSDQSIYSDQGPFLTPDVNLLQNDMKHQLAKIIAGLPKKERLVLSLYYSQDLNLKEIGSVLGVSESRVSQIHSQATLHIKAQLLADA